MGVPDVRIIDGFLSSVSGEMSGCCEEDYWIGFLYGNRDGDILYICGAIVPERQMFSLDHFHVNLRDVAELRKVAEREGSELLGAIHFQGGGRAATHTDMESCFSFAYAEQVGDWLCLVIDVDNGACAYWVSGDEEHCISENTRLAG